jgi:UDP-N-acetylmuramoylalanine--D-glutamate ligase
VITAHAFGGKHYAVYGLARSGLATVEALLASGAKVTAWDANDAVRSSLAAKQRARGTGRRPVEGASRIVTPSVSAPRCHLPR